MTPDFDKIVFIHIQKTAGTSIVEALRPYFKSEETLRLGEFTKVPKAELGRFRLICGHFGYNYIDQLPGRNFRFTFLRNPVERVHSFYHYCRSQNPKQYKIYQLAADLSLQEFAQSQSSYIHSHLDNAQTWQLACGWYPDIRRKMAQHSEQHILDLAMDHLRSLSFVGLTENFDQDARRIYRALGLEELAPLRLNVTVAKPRMEELDRATIMAIRKRVPLDEALYRYAQEKFAKRSLLQRLLGRLRC